ncbi:hypothetical protein ACFCX4_04265 [Kitasatospora sp. NPDC056327]|uniref:hypothetical protein n=1 Tax=Kitasatospora sp. NPDC056327 TaxID=3345785 RepID=UPI0035DAF4B9
MTRTTPPGARRTRRTWYLGHRARPARADRRRLGPEAAATAAAIVAGALLTPPAPGPDRAARPAARGGGPADG